MSNQEVLPNLHAIAAVDLDAGVGCGGKLPWHLPEELDHFKRTTMHSTLIVGRKTWETLPNLRGRVIRVVGKDHESLDDILALIRSTPEVTYWCIGGPTLWKAMLPYCATLTITEIHARFSHDTRFPIRQFLDHFDAQNPQTIATGGTTQIPFIVLKYARK